MLHQLCVLQLLLLALLTKLHGLCLVTCYELEIETSWARYLHKLTSHIKKSPAMDPQIGQQKVIVGSAWSAHQQGHKLYTSCQAIMW